MSYDINQISSEVYDLAGLLEALSKANEYLQSNYDKGCISPMVKQTILDIARNIIDKFDPVTTGG